MLWEATKFLCCLSTEQARCRQPSWKRVFFPPSVTSCSLGRTSSSNDRNVRSPGLPTAQERGPSHVSCDNSACDARSPETTSIGKRLLCIPCSWANTTCPIATGCFLEALNKPLSSTCSFVLQGLRHPQVQSKQPTFALMPKGVNIECATCPKPWVRACNAPTAPDV